MTKSSGNCGFGHIYWRNPSWKTSFLVQWCVPVATPLIFYKALFMDIYGYWSLVFDDKWAQIAFLSLTATPKQLKFIYVVILSYHIVYNHIPHNSLAVEPRGFKSKEFSWKN